MTNLADVVPRTGSLEFNGKHYVLSQLRLRDYAELHRRYLASVKSPLEVVAAGVRSLTAEQAESVLAKAYADTLAERSADPREAMEWAYSSDGLPVLLWLSVRQNSADASAESFAEVLGNSTDLQSVQRLAEDLLRFHEGDSGN